MNNLQILSCALLSTQQATSGEAIMNAELANKITYFKNDELILGQAAENIH